MLFESGLGLVVNVSDQLQNLGQNTRKVVKKYNYMLRKEKEWNHIKCSIKTTKGRMEDKKKDKKQKTVTNMVAINPIISIG